jgi:tripartite-type tricarboxylate transporter receptor subunit TctC
VVPFAAGGPNDVLARLVGEHISRTLAQPVLIENAVGAGGTLGSARVAKAAGDGYTLLSGNLGSLGAAFALYKKIGYDPRDFAAVGMLAGTPNFLVVRKELPPKTLPEFVAYAKARPDGVTVGNAGLGSNAHLVCLYLESLAGIKLRHVPYRGTGPAMTDLMGGQIDAMCDSAPNIVAHVLAGTIRALVVAQTSRVTAVPDVPDAKEAGLPDFNVVGWNAIVAPPRTPKEIVAKANDALKLALTDPGIRKKIEDLGADPAKRRRNIAGMDGQIPARRGQKMGRGHSRRRRQRRVRFARHSPRRRAQAGTVRDYFRNWPDWTSQLDPRRIQA